MKHSAIISIVMVLLCAGAINALVQEAWVAGNDLDVANDLVVDGQGNVYVTGYSLGSGTASDYATIKYGPDGAVLWVARYNGPGNFEDFATALAVDGSGNVYVTGRSYGSGTYPDYATIKYSPSGVEQWVARYNGPGNLSDYAIALAVDASGNVYVTGNSYYATGGVDGATIKYSPSGVEQWVAGYNGPGNDEVATALAVDASGNVYVTGYSYDSGTNWDYATIKYSFSGVEQWVVRYNGPGNSDEIAQALAVDESGNVYVTGVRYSSDSDRDYATIKYSPSGIEQWVSRYNGPANSDDGADALAVDASGNVYVTGHSNDSDTDDDYATIKYSPSGVEQWVSRYNGPANSYDDAGALAVDGQGNVYVTGVSTGSGTGYDYATIKYSSSGVEEWVARYNGPGNSSDYATALAVDGQGNVYVTGNATTIKYTQAAPVPPITCLSFAPKVDFATGTTPTSVVIVDIDGDGKPDLAVANGNSGTESVFHNTSTSGTISFASKVDFATGSYPLSVVIGDIDGDSKPDLAVLNQFSSTVSVLRNTSASGTVSFAKVDFATASFPYDLAIGDIDGDGKPDLVTADGNNSTVSVLRNTSTSGTISFASSVGFATAFGTFNVLVGDIDGDAKPDLIAANTSNRNVSVLRNTSTSGIVSFASKVDFAVDFAGSEPTSAAIGDIDGDGKPDLAVANLSSSTISVLRNTSTTGTVSFASKVDLATGSGPFSVAMDDLDSDGKPDLAAPSSSTSSVSVLRNTSTSGMVSFASKVDFATASGPHRIAIGDVDGDGKSDLATGNANNTVSVLRNTCVQQAGNIVGNVTVSGSGLANVTVDLHKDSSLIASTTTNSNGVYTFSDLEPGSYTVDIIAPLGYVADAESKPATVVGGQTTTVDFSLTRLVPQSTARSVGYWKHQFAVYLTNRGNAQESASNLNSYITLIHQHYDPHFSLFASLNTFQDFYQALSPTANSPMIHKTKMQLCAFLFNMVSNKIGQYTVVTADGRTAGDALTYCSQLATDGNAANDEMSKNIAEMVNTQVTIGVGVVPPSNILYKGQGGSIRWAFGTPSEFKLHEAFPNPFNPSTTISFDLPERSYVSVKVYDILGKEVATLVNGFQDAGYRAVKWYADGMPSGMYFYRLTAGEVIETKKMILLK